MSGLLVSALGVTLAGKRIVSEIALTAAPGQLTGLIGPNGAGKSTLMRALLGLGPIGDGTVTFHGENLLSMPSRQRARTAAFVEQSGQTDARLTAREVVTLGRIPFQSLWQSMPSPEDLAQVDAALDAVDMQAFAARLYHTLSGGEQQRIQIARALAQQPRLLVLDEPTSHLDVHAQLAMLALLQRRARKTGATVLIALHDLNLAASFCDSLVLLHQGRLVTQGTPAEVLTPALLRDIYSVSATLLLHPTSGRPLIAYDLPESPSQ